MLDIENIAAGYGGRPIVQGVGLHVRKGEIVTIIGQNGAGKSTLLKAIAAMAPQRSGIVRLRGEDVSSLSTQSLLRQGLAYIPQGRSLFPRLTVAENLRMGGYLLDDAALLRARIAAQEARFPVLAGLQGQFAASLSGGEQRLLELARTLVMEPDVLMLDEPSIGLAPMVVNALFATLRDLAEQGKAILMVEQNVRAALAASDRGYVLELGAVKLTDSAEALLHDDRVARLYMGVRG